jgi:hypothetical protein
MESQPTLLFVSHYLKDLELDSDSHQLLHKQLAYVKLVEPMSYLAIVQQLFNSPEIISVETKRNKTRNRIDYYFTTASGKCTWTYIQESHNAGFTQTLGTRTLEKQEIPTPFSMTLRAQRSAIASTLGNKEGYFSFLMEKILVKGFPFSKKVFVPGDDLVSFTKYFNPLPALLSLSVENFAFLNRFSSFSTYEHVSSTLPELFDKEILFSPASVQALASNIELGHKMTSILEIIVPLYIQVACSLSQLYSESAEAGLPTDSLSDRYSIFTSLKYEDLPTRDPKTETNLRTLCKQFKVTLGDLIHYSSDAIPHPRDVTCFFFCLPQDCFISTQAFKKIELCSTIIMIETARMLPSPHPRDFLVIE